MEGSCRLYKSSRFCKALLQILLLLGFVWFLLVSVHDNRTSKVTSAQVAGSRGQVTRHVKRNAYRKLELNFVSKRRVPNGPDPIHNRRAGNSHRPPGRA